ncbi:aminotransferase class I/II-fold pyridoxal phosphate-dependent enzyme [Streptomyces broussonetiae]|uniref:homocysteine desulfhydrase n=1 Tax=Streptomyces broussonetiae TaxID=2686304 RepID=A0A6I6MZB6_9ACTN|nr:PLP-dependent aspartate aminotransferase family protein [Streptomyces broussonetiae]QHA04454.1 aminotransferase class I/II-fold pyridoxal phosphate-dependent enzyme [Streptomyces broussonetiae]
MQFDTKLVQIGQEAHPGTGDIVPPIHLASTYEQRAQTDLRYFYGRGENPTREGLERCLASLEDAAYALAFSSGQAAGTTALSLLSPGQKLISSDDVYGGTFSLFDLLPRYGITVEYVDLTDLDALDAALTDDTGLIWIETPTNPLLKVADVRAISERAHARGVPVLVDNTFASPVVQRPLALGADISLYSTTKFISGHSDVIGGALVYNSEEFQSSFFRYRTSAGNVPGALDCYLLHRGVKTMSLRVRRQNESAEQLVQLLRQSPKVGALHYPGLADHPQHETAARQMDGFGSIITFDYLGDAQKLLEKVERFAVAVSLGGVRSLIECPALMTHRPIPAETRRRLGIGDNLIRLAVGIEDVRDLAADLERAL